tara:strand:+ start:556 stop:1098 length:543 start_codon:yes stop_codon:yes gene_type:complete
MGNTNKKTAKKKSAKTKKVADKKILEDLKFQIEEQKAKTEAQIDRYKRLLAEFDNYKRRTEKEKMEVSSITIKNFAIDLITVIDDFERTLDLSSNEGNEESYIDGVKLIYEKMNKILMDKGIKSFNSMGEIFDPEIHEAISSQKNKKYKDGTILNEFLKGYKYKGKIIRHSKVIVAKNKK